MIDIVWNFIVSTLPGKTLYILFIMLSTIVVATLVNIILSRMYNRHIRKKKKYDLLGKTNFKLGKTKFIMLKRFMVTGIYVFGAITVMFAIPQLRELSYSMFAGAGVIAIIIGFATQEVFSNIVSGIFISIFEPFRIDDRVKIGKDGGYVQDITLWHTIIKDFNNQRLMIPNSIIAKERILNETIDDSKAMNFISFDISYDSSIDLARKIIMEETGKSEFFIDNREEHELLAGADPYSVRVVGHGDFAINLRLYVWTKDAPDGFQIKCQLYEAVKKRFDKEGIEIPFPYRTIVHKKDLSEPKKMAVKKKKKK